MPTIDWHHEAIDQLDRHWRTHARQRLVGLTDHEYLWEPVPGCWSVHRRADAEAAGRTGVAGVGDVVVDFVWPPPDPAPVTTIAWRLAHLTVAVFGERASSHFGDGSFGDETADWTLSASDALARLDHWYAAWIDGVRARGPAGMSDPTGPTEGPFADYPFGGLVLHISREAIHHLAEIALLRDLYRARAGVR